MIEILVAISIILVLAGMTLGATRYMLIKADKSRTKALIKQIESAMVQYKGDWGFYPQQATAGVLLGSWFESGGLEKPNGKLYLDLKGIGFTILAGSPRTCLDPFDEPIFYQCPGTMNAQSFDVWSKGVDMEHGEAGSGNTIPKALVVDENNDDICNWKRGS